MSEAPTILDYLNEDCWRAVLDRVPVRDIIISERVSRRWQQVVLPYLAHVRIGIGMLGPDNCLQNDTLGICLQNDTLGNVHWLTLNEDKRSISSFDSWTKKLGASVVASYCILETIDTIGLKCPNLEAVLFYEVPEELLLDIPYENFTRLRHLHFENCIDVSDACVSQFLNSKVLETLEFFNNQGVEGQCLTNIKSTNFKSLVFQRCFLDCEKLFAAFATADCFGELKKLVLRELMEETIIPEDISEQVVSMLGKTPKLEYLDMFIEMDLDGFFEAVCRLKNLVHIRVPFEPRDKEIEAIMRCCPRLQFYHLICDEVWSPNCFIVYEGKRMY